MCSLALQRSVARYMQPQFSDAVQRPSYERSAPPLTRTSSAAAHPLAGPTQSSQLCKTSSLDVEKQWKGYSAQHCYLIQMLASTFTTTCIIFAPSTPPLRDQRLRVATKRRSHVQQQLQSVSATAARLRAKLLHQAGQVRQGMQQLRRLTSENEAHKARSAELEARAQRADTLLPKLEDRRHGGGGGCLMLAGGRFLYVCVWWGGYCGYQATAGL